MRSFDILGRGIGPAHPCYVIAEAGVNHNGDIRLAHLLVDVAVEAGADAVKFQTFKADKLISPQAEKAQYQKDNTGGSESQLEMIRRLELTLEDHHALKSHCESKGITFLSTPFEEESADFLDQLGISAFKLPSGEITNLPFLRHVAAKNRPIILSTGMSSLGEVEVAVEAIAQSGTGPLALLHCTSAYPSDPAQTNLRAMATLAQAFGVPVGFSDHTPGIAVSIAAAALGAVIIEKHFTLDQALPGPDHRASLEPKELAAMVVGIRTVQMALGDGIKRPQAIERDTARVARKSLVAIRDLTVGAVIDDSMIAILRPGTGIAPAQFDQVLGRVVKTSVGAGTPLQWSMLA